jgi:hypothetical protein
VVAWPPGTRIAETVDPDLVNDGFQNRVGGA